MWTFRLVFPYPRFFSIRSRLVCKALQQPMATWTVSLFLVISSCGTVSCLRKGRTNAADASNKSSGTVEATEHCGSCDALDSYLWWEAWNPLATLGASDTAIGNTGGLCCRILSRFSTRPTELASSTKIITTYTMLKLVDEGLLTLDTKVADVLDFWSAEDYRKDVTLRHLLSFTSGLGMFPGGFAECTTGNNTRDCAKEAFNTCFYSGALPGAEFTYSEASWYVVGAIALELTGLQLWDDVFQQYIAGPLGITPSSCEYSFPEKHHAYVGGGLVCDTVEFSKVLQGILAKTLLNNKTLFDEAERPHTLGLKLGAQPEPWQTCNEVTRPLGCIDDMMPLWPVEANAGLAYQHYGLGQWVECATPACEGGVLRTSSSGGLGTYPWIDRGGLSGNRPHFGVVVRLWLPSEGSLDMIVKEVLPMAAAIVQ